MMIVYAVKDKYSMFPFPTQDYLFDSMTLFMTFLSNLYFIPLNVFLMPLTL